MVLNAGGPGTSILPLGKDGLIETDQDGLWKVATSTYSGPTKPATLPEVQTAFTNFKKPQVTAVFGDHGTEKGVSLWDEADLSPKEFHTLQTSLPDATLFRSIHLHCHAKAVVLDPERKKPAGPEEWPQYLKDNYRKNSCSLVTSDADEVSDYLDFGTPWEDGQWNKILGELKDPSLKTLRDRVVETKGYHGTIRLTSDMLAEDIFDAFCAQGARGFSPPGSETGTPASRGAGAEPPSERSERAETKDEPAHSGPERKAAPSSGRTSSTQRAQAAPSDACFKGDDKADIERLDADVKKHHDLYMNVMGLIGELGNAYIRARWPEKADNFKLSMKALEEPLVRKAMGEPLPDGNFEKFLARVGASAKANMEQYSLLHAQMSHGELDWEWFNTESKRPEFRSWLEEPGVKEEFAAVLARMKEPGSKDKGIFDLQTEVMAGYDRARGERKKYYRRRQGTRRTFVQRLFEERREDPQIAPLKEYYESILRCETSSLR